jgi:hypothetical protein
MPSARRYSSPSSGYMVENKAVVEKGSPDRYNVLRLKFVRRYYG